MNHNNADTRCRCSKDDNALWFRSTRSKTHTRERKKRAICTVVSINYNFYAMLCRVYKKDDECWQLLDSGLKQPQTYTWTAGRSLQCVAFIVVTVGTPTRQSVPVCAALPPAQPPCASNFVASQFPSQELLTSVMLPTNAQTRLPSEWTNTAGECVLPNVLSITECWIYITVLPLKHQKLRMKVTRSNS